MRAYEKNAGQLHRPHRGLNGPQHVAMDSWPKRRTSSCCACAVQSHIRFFDIFDGNTFQFGEGENRPTWEQMALYTFQQGIAHQQFNPKKIPPIA